MNTNHEHKPSRSFAENRSREEEEEGEKPPSPRTGAYPKAPRAQLPSVCPVPPAATASCSPSHARPLAQPAHESHGPGSQPRLALDEGGRNGDLGGSEHPQP